jgi:alkanesulfonate monooxygenase SsuD/methylene tetrahydromethanopterin reductase-like flavin-dependent oxidoreductase (luciferase family)
VLERFRSDPVVASIFGAIDGKASNEQLDHIATLLPDEWLAAAATGTPSQCVERIRQELSYGADRVILHGATPDELEPIIAEYNRAEPKRRHPARIAAS